MNKIEYCELKYSESEIVNLYENLGWSNYMKDKESLFKGIKGSLYCRGAYDAGKLVGLIRVVGDGSTIIYIQDILILESHQRLGIGTALIQHVLDKYKSVRQICLTTDLERKQIEFYESVGFKKYSDSKMTGFMLKK